MANDGHHAALVVEDRPVMHFFGVFAFPGHAFKTAPLGNADARHLRLLLEVVHAVKYRVLQRQFDRFAVGEDAFDFVIEVVPFRFAPEVINHQEAAVLQIPSQRFDLVFGEFQTARFDHVDEGIIEQFRIGQLDDFAFGIDFQRRQLLQAIGKVQVAVGVVGRPPPPTAGRVVLDADEREDVVGELVVVLPVGNAVTFGALARSGETGLKLTDTDCHQHAEGGNN